MTGPPPIEVVHVGDAELSDDVVRELVNGISRMMGTPVSLGERLALSELIPSSASSAPTDPDDDRLCSNRLVDSLREHFSRADAGGPHWVLGVTAHDLYAPDRPFVFGEATFGGRWAVVSAARFGIPARGSPRLLDRLLKESLHELGHLGSVGHCDESSCVMSTSRRVADIDRKNLEFCGDCARRIFPDKGS